jgi:hypothetical protein
MGRSSAIIGLAALGAVLVVAASADGATLPPPVVADHDGTLPNHADDVVDYTLRATLDATTHTVHGQGTIVWRNTSDVSVNEIPLHLYLNAFKNERSCFLRDPISSGRGTGAVADWGYIDINKLVARDLGNVDLWPGADKTSPGEGDDQTDIRVPLPSEIPPKGSLTLDVVWDAKLPSIVERTGYFGSFHMVAQWFPKVARLEKDGFAHFALHHLSEFYADFGTYDVTIDVPDGYTIGATGARVEQRHAGGRTIERYTQADVHDFAWTAWDGFREKTAESGGVSIRCLFPTGYDAVADRHIETAKFGLSHFGSLYGSYPYRTLTIVAPPRQAEEAAGMEYPTLITTMGAWYEPPVVHGAAGVTLHELGHQWFYGMVASNEARWPFLDEGLTSYAESEGLSAMLGPNSAVGVMGAGIGVGEILRMGAIEAGHQEPVAQASAAFTNGANYGSLAYARTATILDTFAGAYGRDELGAAIGSYARRHRFGHPSAEDFILSIRESLGDAAARNLHEALFERGWVDYLVREAISRRDAVPAGIFERNGKRETVGRQTPNDGLFKGWALVIRQGTLHFPVNIDLFGADGSTTRVRWDGAGDFVRIPYEGKSELVRVLVDPGASIKLDENLFNNAWQNARRGVPARALERATYWAEIALSAFLP